MKKNSFIATITTCAILSTCIFTACTQTDIESYKEDSSNTFTSSELYSISKVESSNQSVVEHSNNSSKEESSKSENSVKVDTSNSKIDSSLAASYQDFDLYTSDIDQNKFNNQVGLSQEYDKQTKDSVIKFYNKRKYSKGKKIDCQSEVKQLINIGVKSKTAYTIVELLYSGWNHSQINEAFTEVSFKVEDDLFSYVLNENTNLILKCNEDLILHVYVNKGYLTFIMTTP